MDDSRTKDVAAVNLQAIRINFAILADFKDASLFPRSRRKGIGSNSVVTSLPQATRKHAFSTAEFGRVPLAAATNQRDAHWALANSKTLTSLPNQDKVKTHPCRRTSRTPAARCSAQCTASAARHHPHDCLSCRNHCDARRHAGAMQKAMPANRSADCSSVRQILFRSRKKDSFGYSFLVWPAIRSTALCGP